MKSPCCLCLPPPPNSWKPEKTAVARRRLSKHVPVTMNTLATVEELLDAVLSVRSSCITCSIYSASIVGATLPRGGGVEYLHRNPVSRRRRRKWKSRIWDSKIWSRVPRDLDPKITALARASSNCKRQTRPFARESAPHQQTRKSELWDVCKDPRLVVEPAPKLWNWLYLRNKIWVNILYTVTITNTNRLCQHKKKIVDGMELKSIKWDDILWYKSSYKFSWKAFNFFINYGGTEVWK
jgi:hypothetical protein